MPPFATRMGYYAEGPENQAISPPEGVTNAVSFATFGLWLNAVPDTRLETWSAPALVIRRTRRLKLHGARCTRNGRHGDKKAGPRIDVKVNQSAPCSPQARQCFRRRARLAAAALAAVAMLPLTPGCGRIQRFRAELHVDEAEKFIESNDLASALKEFEAAVELSPQLAVAHSQMGVIYRKTGDYDRAIECFAEAVRLMPYSFVDTFNLAQLYHFTNRLQDAVEAYLHACDLRPDDFDASLNLGVCYQQLNEYGQAAERFQRSISIDPTRPHAYVNLGVALDRQGKYYEAINAYKAALELDTHQPRVLINLGYTYMNQDRLTLAKRTFEQAVIIDDGLAATHEALGYCLFRLRDYPEARKAYRRALELDPMLASAHAGLGSIEMLMHLNHEPDADPELALEYWHRSLELNTNQPKIRRLIEKYHKTSRDPDTILLDNRRTN